MFASSIPLLASCLQFYCVSFARLAFTPLLHRISLAFASHLPRFASLLPHVCLSFALRVGVVQNTLANERIDANQMQIKSKSVLPTFTDQLF